MIIFIVALLLILVIAAFLFVFSVLVTRKVKAPDDNPSYDKWTIAYQEALNEINIHGRNNDQ